MDGICGFRRDSQRDRSGAGNGNNRTWQNVHDQGTATYCIHVLGIHVLAPLFECLFGSAA